MNIEPIRQRLSRFKPAHWAQDPVSAGFVRSIDCQSDVLTIAVTLPFADLAVAEQLNGLNDELCELAGAHRVDWQLHLDVATLAHANDAPALSGVRNIIAVSSGKGGVGKSTTAVNLALALSRLGGRVGLLDADIYGPSIPMMLGVAGERPASDDGKTMAPVQAHGVKANSIGFLVGANDATVWRGPMASKALEQILRETRWGELDYLVVDLPPGTGDIQLTIAQQVPTTAAVVVTTPQNVALADAVKGINMFGKVNIPVLGVVENMSYHQCSQCGHKENLFGEGGGGHLCNEHGVPLLGQMPLNATLCQQMDAGTPVMVVDPGSEVAGRYLDMAARLAASLYFSGKKVPTTLYTRLV
ncbi:iron-sulfur cluster carrier protein ApbC [Oceanimonas baumannii]|uniref:Iron-sulfur cluster carrier protein n=1 Tax=Oceanimonas baumannii TaxID=129578 RepID=A0A235CH60_9GAMM|nr:iron-sulfur cluster carrier protein ApbC [Oceanimonas baumannii]OYD23951.1 Fe-S-binding ATPase [Oceanimonas baumannii]TDW58716.1 ATP-binding protein involved in chromosome partitioning [Oceanimonas baumannii]